MKKIFNYALLAAALLVGVNVNAQNNCMVQIGEGQPKAANFVDVLASINGEDYIDQTVVITLTDNITIQNPTTGKYYDFSIFPGKTKKIDVTIDMNGKNIVGAPETFYRIRIFKGKLTFTGKGVIEEIASSTQDYAGGSVLSVAGTGDDVEETYAELIVDKDVTIVSPMSYGVVLFYAQYGFSLTGETDTKVSNGAVFTVKGTINARTPVSTNGTMSYMTDVDSPNGEFKQAKKYPVVNIESTAVLIGNHSEAPLSQKDLKGTVDLIKLDEQGKPVVNEKGNYVKESKTKEQLIHEAGYPDATQYLSSSTCVYAPGYAIYNIKGRIEGGIGIYAKAGKLNIDGAVIKAVSEHYFKPIAYGNGCIGSGSALVLDSHAGYGKFDGASIANSTLSSDNGYAIEETVTTGGEKLPVIEVESGTFVGGQGAITTTDEVKGEIIDRGSITGGEWHNSNVDQYLDDDHTTLDFVDGDGKHYQIVVPIKETDWSQSIADAAAQTEKPKYAKVAANEDVENDTKVEFVRIPKDVVVTVKSGATLDAGTLMIEGPTTTNPGGETGKIIVEAGGTLIVSGKQGAYTYDENSLVVETSEANPGIVLINPAVVLNTTPKATVKFISKSYYNSTTDYQFQYFGTPMVGQVKSIKPDKSVQTSIELWNAASWEWNSLGILSADGTGLTGAIDAPFGFYNMIVNSPSSNGQITYTITGNLIGNTTPEINLPAKWNSMANSYSGKIGTQALLNALKAESNLGKSIYVYQKQGKYLIWHAANELSLPGDLAPMAAFMLVNNTADNKVISLDYTNLVWTPATTTGSNAPRANQFAKATINVNGENMGDVITVAEDGQFSSDFEDGYDAEKFDNKVIKFYVNANGEYDIYATDNLNNTFVGFNTTKAGKYTISFENVTGNFALIDNKTNARIEMNEGTTYEFIANAGEDAYRFMIVRGAQAPTDMQKTNAAVKATKALINNQIVISNGERFFNVLGTEVK